MGLVKTAEEIERIEEALSAPRWSGEWLSVQFLTEPATLLHLLPPPLEPAPEPLATATIGRWQSSCLGDFAGGVLSLAARHDGVDGSYVLALYMDREPPIVFGRDLYGEPKKLATAGLFHDRGHVHGWIERHGCRLIELRAEVGDDAGPSRHERVSFNFKARTATTGRGLEEDAILTRTRFAVELRSSRAGNGTVELVSGVHDRLAELEVVEVRGAIYGEDQSEPSCEAVATVSSAEFLPYHYGRQDDWLALSESPRNRATIRLVESFRSPRTMRTDD
jgi:acetoacetate decarboxylase